MTTRGGPTEPPEPALLLAVEGMQVRFGGVDAVVDLSFAVSPGECVALIGPNGAGKTTALNAVNGLVRATAGRVLLSGVDVTGERPSSLARRGVSRTFQSPGTFEQLDVVTNVLLGRHRHMRSGFLTGMARLGRTAREERVQREVVSSLVGRLGLDRYGRAAVGQLPYGVQKRIDLARALASEPKLLLLDEPGGGTDDDEWAAMVATIRQARADDPRLGLVLVAHDMAMVEALSDRVLVLDFGELVAAGTFDDVRRHPRVLEVYLGEATR